MEPNQAMQLTVGRFEASHYTMKTRPLQFTLALSQRSLILFSLGVFPSVVKSQLRWSEWEPQWEARIFR